MHVDRSGLIAHHEQRTIDKIKGVSEKLPATLRAFAQLLREGKINVIGNANGLVFGRVQSPLAAPQRLERNFSPVLPIDMEALYIVAPLVSPSMYREFESLPLRHAV